MSSDATPSTGNGSPTSRARVLLSWGVSVVLGVVVYMVYISNQREIGTFDTAPITATAVCLNRGDGLYIERFLPCWGLRRDRKLPTYLAEWRGRVISRYPIAPAFLALPFVACQTAYCDRMVPGWDRYPPVQFYRYCLTMAKVAAALIAALTAVVLHRVLSEMGLVRVAIPATLAAAFGSELWTVASQALWGHGPAALALITSVWLLLPRDPARWRLLLAGGVAAALVAFRLNDFVFSLAIGGWVAHAHPRRLAWFLPGPILGASALFGSNLWFFGAITGGQAYLESLHPTVHALPAGPWSGSLPSGAAGTLLSPNRGLLVYTPWVGLALATLPFCRRRLAPWPMIRWLLWALVPFGLLMSKYTVWWGGHCFGPRYWTEVTPLFAIMLACGLEWSYAHRRLLAMAFALASVFSIGVQAIGAFCYPCTWDFEPANVDLHHERLWDWRDNQLRRCLIDGPARRVHATAADLDRLVRSSIMRPAGDGSRRASPAHIKEDVVDQRPAPTARDRRAGRGAARPGDRQDGLAGTGRAEVYPGRSPVPGAARD